LIAVKRHARRLTSPGVSDMPAEVHRVAYFASIAAAIVRLGERITKSSPEVLRVAFEQLGLESWTEDWLHELFESALRRASADSRL
jgi:hypothetical protein